MLYLRPGTREHFLENLARDWPALLPMYERMYAGRAYVAKAVVEPVRARVRALAREAGVADRRATDPTGARTRGRGRATDAGRVRRTRRRPERAAGAVHHGGLLRGRGASRYAGRSPKGVDMETVTVVLNVAKAHV